MLIFTGRSRLAIILASVSAAVAAALIIATAFFCARRKVVRKRRGMCFYYVTIVMFSFNRKNFSTHFHFLFASEKKQLGPLMAIVNKSKLNFSYETLERATNYFDQSNKLGQGGSGSVYKV